MANSNVINALAKVLIAAAWADGSITNDELNNLKDLLFQLPEMTASDWDELDIYIDSPVGEAERKRLIVNLQNNLSSQSEKDMAISAIEEMITADHEISESERVIADEIEAAIQDVNTGFFGKMGKSFLNDRTKAVANAPNRELFLDDFEKNKVFYSISRRLELDNDELNIPESELRKLSLAGGLMARVAYVDRVVDESEINTMVTAIHDHWDISEVEASMVAEIAVSEISKDIDYYYLSRNFFENTTEDERIRFLDVLFAVADGDGYVTNSEIEEIRTIAKVQKLTHKQFIDAKLKIPKDRRAT